MLPMKVFAVPAGSGQLQPGASPQRHEQREDLAGAIHVRRL
jgi:hypothetical protein